MFRRPPLQWNIQFRKNNIVITNSLYAINNAKLIFVEHDNVIINIFEDCVWTFPENTIWTHPNKDIYLVMDDLFCHFELFANVKSRPKNKSFNCYLSENLLIVACPREVKTKPPTSLRSIRSFSTSFCSPRYLLRSET